jgi:cytochrome bd ubiquinol oxidase subunit I
LGGRRPTRRSPSGWTADQVRQVKETIPDATSLDEPFVHKLRFALKPVETLRKLCLGAFGFTALFTVLNVIPADADLVPQIGLVFGRGEGTQIPLGSMYPWKYIGLIGLMLVGFFVLALYLRASVGGFRWGRASRWSQVALMICSVTVVLTMVDMGSTRESARRVDNDPGYLIYKCVTLEQKFTPETCPAGESPTKGVGQGLGK